jgi:hypothetical protein
LQVLAEEPATVTQFSQARELKQTDGQPASKPAATHAPLMMSVHTAGFSAISVPSDA